MAIDTHSTDHERASSSLGLLIAGLALVALVAVGVFAWSRTTTQPSAPPPQAATPATTPANTPTPPAPPSK